MNVFGVDIATMLDDLKLPLAAIRWKEILRGPELEWRTFPPSSFYGKYLSLNILNP